MDSSVGQKRLDHSKFISCK